MKKTFLTMLMTTVLLLLLTTVVMAEADPSFRFSLQIDGKAEKSAAAGDTVTVVFSMERTDSTSPCTLYAIQNEIRYDSTFFELVPDSFLVQDGIQTNDFPAGAQDREIYMNWLSLTGGAHWKARTIVGSFQMRVIGTSGAGSLRNMNCSVSRPDGSGSYPLAAEDVIVVVSEDCTVTFSPGEGMAVSSQTVKRQSKAVQPANPIRPGYTFTGWYTDADCTQRWDFADAVLWNLHLYAGWENIDRSSAA
ncbi:MAG: InlB B-repeat-containing protein, partial [Clostridia bacterium]|nr:InlB B-repeat-containing protein [Clostridia bacterium]